VTDVAESCHMSAAAVWTGHPAEVVTPEIADR